MKSIKKALIVIASLMFIIGTFAAIEPTTYKFKNLKVLPKNISEDELDKIMDSYKVALGVKCGYCHERSDSIRHFDFASDAKPEKETARKMMLMTDGINKKYFNFNKEQIVPKTINCITCHRGIPKPVMDSIAMPIKRAR